MGSGRRSSRSSAPRASRWRSSTSSPASTSPIPTAWEHVGSVDLACLNAGVLTGGDGIADLTDEQYRRAVARERRRSRLRRAPARPASCEPGSVDRRDRIARRADADRRRPDLRPDEARRRRLRPLGRAAARRARHPHPGRLPRLGRHRAHGRRRSRSDLVGRGYRLLRPEDVADGVWAAYKSEDTGEAWVVQPGREPLLYEFKGVPGPR